MSLVLPRRWHSTVKARICSAELKWTKVSDQKFTEYRALIDLFFSVNPLFHFKAIVVDTQEIDNRRYNKEELLDLALPLSPLPAEIKNAPSPTPLRATLVRVSVTSSRFSDLVALLPIV